MQTQFKCGGLLVCSDDVGGRSSQPTAAKIHVAAKQPRLNANNTPLKTGQTDCFPVNTAVGRFCGLYKCAATLQRNHTGSFSAENNVTDRLR